MVTVDTALAGAGAGLFTAGGVAGGLIGGVAVSEAPPADGDALRALGVLGAVDTPDGPHARTTASIAAGMIRDGRHHTLIGGV